MECLKRETAVLTSLDHPNILKIYDFVHDEETSFITRELFHGKALCDIIPTEGFDLEIVPEAEELHAGITKDTINSPEHKWFAGKMTREEREKITNFYKEKYGTSE